MEIVIKNIIYNDLITTCNSLDLFAHYCHGLIALALFECLSTTQAYFYALAQCILRLFSHHLKPAPLFSVDFGPSYNKQYRKDTSFVFTNFGGQNLFYQP